MTEATGGADVGILQDNVDDLSVRLADLIVGGGLLDRRTLEMAMVARSADVPPARQIVVRAWRDPVFRVRLLTDPHGACAEAGVDIAPHWPRVAFLDNTGPMHHVIVCTLCSCHSRPLMGVPPRWYKSQAYRARTVREPRRVLAEFGVHIAPDRPVRVQDASADYRYLVLPAPPIGFEYADDESLAATVTSEVLLGVALPHL